MQYMNFGMPSMATYGLSILVCDGKATAKGRVWEEKLLPSCNLLLPTLAMLVCEKCIDFVPY